MPIDEKRGWSTHVIRNAGSLEELAAAVDRFWATAVE
jgi:dephospho-CoA kinase